MMVGSVTHTSGGTGLTRFTVQIDDNSYHPPALPVPALQFKCNGENCEITLRSEMAV